MGQGIPSVPAQEPSGHGDVITKHSLMEPKAAKSRAGHPNTAFAASFQVPSRTDRGLLLHSEGLLKGTLALLGQ